MSVFGGDSWGREAAHRKRRVDDLMLERVESSSFKKLSNGKFSCLVCPNSPTLDSPSMLSIHNKGSRHQAALSRLTEKELTRQEEIKKRIALSGHDHHSSSCSSSKTSELPSNPLIEKTRKAVAEVLESITKCPAPLECRSQKLDSSVGNSFQHSMGNRGCNYGDCNPSLSVHVEDKPMASQHSLSFQERREKELTFTASGWKRDCHGKWYRDENVEFDSDEEDPNIALA